MAFLEIKNVSKLFGKNTVAVENFNLDVEKGELVSFLGPSGCGKTTTLRIVAGFETPTTGQVIIDGRDVTNVPPNQRNVGMVFQAYALFPNMTVAGNIGFGLKIAKKPPEEIRQRVDEMLKLIHMEGFGDRYPYQLSGGQQQRVALARALALRPSMLLLDEPLSALDAKIRIMLRSEIRAIQQELGITTIYVTHDQEEALCMADRIALLHQGHLLQVGNPYEIHTKPNTAFVARFLGANSTLKGRVYKQNDRFYVRIGQVTFPLQQTDFHENQELTLLFRNTEASLVENIDQIPSDRVFLQGKVTGTIYPGSIFRHEVEIVEGAKVYVDSSQHFHEGSSVYVTIPYDRLYLYSVEEDLVQEGLS